MSKHQLSETENKLLMKGFDWETDSNGYDPGWDEDDILKHLKIDPTLTAKPLSNLTNIPVHRVIAATIRLKTSGKLPKIPPPNIVKFPVPEVCSTGNIETAETTAEPLTVITLWQPWATFIVKGIKCFETRSWYTSHRGKILIHAAKRPINWLEIPLTALRKYLPDIDSWDDFPTGAIVGEANLLNCHRVESVRDDLDGLETLCGDYSNGRFAWELASVKPLLIPNVKGKQGLWKYELTVNEPSVNDAVLGETSQSDVTTKPDIPHWITGRNAAEAKALIDSGFCYIGTVEQFEEPEDSCTNYGDWQFYHTQYFIEARCNGAVFNREESDKPNNELVDKAIATIKKASEEWGNQFGEQLNLLDNILLTEPPRQVETNGQLSLFFDDSEEPPDPDDYQTGDEYEEAYDRWAALYPELERAISAKNVQETLNRHREQFDYVQLISDPRRIGQIIGSKSGGLIKVKFADGFTSDFQYKDFVDTPFSKANSDVVLGESFFKVGEQVQTSAPSYEGKVFTVATIYPTGMIGVVSNGNSFSFPANWLDHHVEQIKPSNKSIPLEQTDSKKSRPAKGCGSGYLKVREANVKRNAAKGKSPDVYYVYYYSYSNQYGKEIKSSISVPRAKIAQVKKMVEDKEHYVKIAKFLGKSLPLSY